MAEEHPEITNPVDGYKARKAVTIFRRNLSEDDFKKKIANILSSDTDIKDVESCAEHLWKKYSFASDFYKNEKNLIISITYKKGECKDYSFHSLSFLHGVVKYKSA